MAEPMVFEDLEKVYEALAEVIDAVGRDREVLFLTKLTMVLAHRVGDLQAVEEAIDIARREGSGEASDAAG